MFNASRIRKDLEDAQNSAIPAGFRYMNTDPTNRTSKQCECIILIKYELHLSL